MATTLQELVDSFSENIARYKSTATKEATLRLEYLDPFLRLLGWDVGNSRRLPPAEQEVEIEPSIEVADRDRLRARRPDYVFRIDRLSRFTCEAKKPNVDIDRDTDAIFQAKRDAYNMGVPFAILTDFEQFRVYDAGYKPDINAPGHGLVRELSFNFGDYLTQWDVLERHFSRDAVAGGSLEALRAKIRKTRAGTRIRGLDRELFELRGDVAPGKAFLGMLQTQREHVAADLYRHNRAYFPHADTPAGSAKLAEFTQRLLDRVVFMRICEDRGVVPYGLLRDLVEQSQETDRSLRDLLAQQFEQFRRDFNGYLFAPHDISRCDFTSNTLRDLIAELYPPEGPWNFATMPDDLLATVYEQFLGSTISVHGGRVSIEEKPEVRHAGGVYYTPRFIVDSILRRVVAPKLEGRAPLDLLNYGLTILDPACGSGSFLVRAFDFIIDHCERAINADPKLADKPLPGTRRKHPIAFKQAVNQGAGEGPAANIQHVWRLTPDFKGRLLQSCIFGIDIDGQAREVSVMSLYVKMLANLPADWRGISENMLLPSLDNNIRCGNSLIDQERLDAYALERHGDLFGGDENVLFRINAFDWGSESRGFGRVLAARGGFDCVIGNPPYIRVQELNQWAPEECQFYKWQYDSAARGNYDIYVAFTERVLTGGHHGRGLLAKGGRLGFIMPHKWWQASYGEGLREVVASKRSLLSVVDFGDEQIFRGATTYVAIHVLGLEENESGVDMAVVHQLTDGRSICEAIDSDRESADFERFATEHPQHSSPWLLQNNERIEWCQKVAEGTERLSDIATKIFVGLQTSADTVFLFKQVDIHGALARCMSKELGQIVEIETELLRPVIRSGEIGRFWAVPSAHVLFPYVVSNDRANIIPANLMAERYPKAWAYLLRNAELLKGRESGRFDHEEWYGLMRKNLESWEGPKLMIPYMITELGSWFDEVGDKYFVNVTTGGFGLRSIKIGLHLLSGLLNSSLLDTWFKFQAGKFHSGYFGANKQYIENLPIKLPRTPAERTIAARIETSVRQIMAAKAALRVDGLSDREREGYERTIEAGQKRIDNDVMALYGVDALPV